MKKVLIINAHQFYEIVSKGELTQKYIDYAKDFFLENGFEVNYTHLEKGYDKDEEINKLDDADYVFFQYPVYWMSAPWIAKKYFDEVITMGLHYESDGRDKNDPSKRYGSGGLLKGKYMLSITYNCPISEFNNKNGYFEGLSLDEANFSIHKVFQFLGLKQLKTYAVNDIFNGIDFNEEKKKFLQLLESNFKN